MAEIFDRARQVLIADVQRKRKFIMDELEASNRNFEQLEVWMADYIDCLSAIDALAELQVSKRQEKSDA